MNELLQKITPVHLYGLDLVIPDQTYFPAEDTELAIEGINEWVAREKDTTRKYQICEIGTGSGVLILTIAKRLLQKHITASCVGVDVNGLAVEAGQYNIQKNGFLKDVIIYKGNLFDPLPETSIFDLIIFNPPYLAGDDLITSENRQAIDSAWEGGSQGSEFTVQFLDQVPRFLRPLGQLLFISSSLIDQQPILDCLAKKRLGILSLKKKHYFFEDILLYSCMKE